MLVVLFVLRGESGQVDPVSVGVVLNHPAHVGQAQEQVYRDLFGCLIFRESFGYGQNPIKAPTKKEGSHTGLETNITPKSLF